jgi:hypothetical protein
LNSCSFFLVNIDQMEDNQIFGKSVLVQESEFCIFPPSKGQVFGDDYKVGRVNIGRNIDKNLCSENVSSL